MTLKRFRTWWPLTGILLAALLLRVIALETRGLWYDDTFSIFLSQQSLARIVSGTAADTMPPLYYFLLHGWMLFGSAVWWMRLLNVIPGVGLVALLYAWATRLAGRKAGLWAALFAAVSPLEIYHAQELRMYVLLTLALLGYAWFFTRLYQRSDSVRSSWGDWLGLVACGAAAMYSHNLAVFSLVAPNVFLILKRDGRLLVRLVLAQAVIALVALPWLVLVPGQIVKIQRAFWTPRPGVKEVIQALISANANLPLPAGLLPLALLVSLLAVALVLFETLRRERGRAQDVGLLATFALVPPALLFVASYIMRPVFVPRAFMFSFLAYFALAGRAAATAKVRGIRWLIALLFVLPALAVLPFQYTFTEFPRSPFQQATEFLRERIQPGEVVLHDNKLSYFPARYYAPDLPQMFLADPPGSHNDTLAPASQEAMGLFPVLDLHTATGGAKHVWFVVFDGAIREYEQAGQPDHPVRAYLGAAYLFVSVNHFNDLAVYEYRWP